MRMVKFLFGLAAFVGICMVSFNYIEGHESTAKNKVVTELERRIEKLLEGKNKISQDKANIKGRLRQACELLKTAEIENDLCEQPDEENADG